MRVVLVGPRAGRQRLLAQLPDCFDVAAEVDTIREARALNDQPDAYIVAPRVIADEESLIEHLTTRESEVIALVADGLSNKAIAQRLSVSDETIKFHLSSIFGKLHASNRTDAVRQALRRGLIPL